MKSNKTNLSIFFLIFVTASILLIVNPLNAQTEPVLFFSDLTWGPKGEFPLLNTANASRGIICVANCSPYGHVDYVTMSKIYNRINLNESGYDACNSEYTGSTTKWVASTQTLTMELIYR